MGDPTVDLAGHVFRGDAQVEGRLGQHGVDELVGGPLLGVILISWGFALVEYCFAVPANRLGYSHGWSGAQLKIVQEAISITAFAIFMVTYLGEPLHWRQAAAFLCIIAAVAFLFVGK